MLTSLISPSSSRILYPANSLIFSSLKGQEWVHRPMKPGTTRVSIHQPPLNDSSSVSSLHRSQSHTPIMINGNSDFLSQASNEGWTGTGTVADPFLIVGYNITNYSSLLIDIRNTNLSFQITNNFLKWLNDPGTMYSAIFFENVTDGIISNNIITECAIGANLWTSTSIQVSNSTFSHNFNFILVYYSRNISFVGNYFSDSTAGIDVINTEASIFSNNTITDCYYPIQWDMVTGLSRYT